MQDVIELNCEETKAVVGGAMGAQSAYARQSPLERLIGIIVRDIENAFGGGRTTLAAQK
jgi:hypothetical protein